MPVTIWGRSYFDHMSTEDIRVCAVGLSPMHPAQWEVLREILEERGDL